MVIILFHVLAMLVEDAGVVMIPMRARWAGLMDVAHRACLVGSTVFPYCR